jgi:hypothetical protein
MVGFSLTVATDLEVLVLRMMSVEVLSMVDDFV